MKQHWLCAAIAALGVAIAASAVAQPAPPMRPGMMSSDEVLTMVRSTGLNPLERPVRRGTTYTLRAGTADGKPMRVVVDGRAGQIVSVAPIGDARLAPGPGLTLGPYEPIRPGPGVRQPGPPQVYDPDPPIIYGTRPPVPVPDPEAGLSPGPRQIGPPRDGVSAAPLPAPLPPSSVPPVANAPSDVVGVPPGAEPRLIAPEPNEGGLLPPPPERFPQRAPPLPEPKAKPAPPKRAAAAPPQQTPLPRPRPSGVSAQPAPAPAAVPAPPPAPESKPAPEQVPH